MKKQPNNQNNLFSKPKAASQKRPLADLLRPNNLEAFVGQNHLVGENGIITNLLNSNTLPSMIFWGPPGVGKTTLAKVLANNLNYKFLQISAVTSGKKDLQNVIRQAKEIQQFDENRQTILFIDEIHRFNKVQQDYLLPFVENGTIVLIGATTENPSFEVISALLSRCKVITFTEYSLDELNQILQRGIDYLLTQKKFKVNENLRNIIIKKSNGDPRTLLNSIEIAFNLLGDKNEVTQEIVKQVFQTTTLLYDKNGEEHYNIISAFIKSMRASDPNAALYWLARMIKGGEDPKFIARRCVILASEDIGNSDPQALILANSAFEAVNKIGWPESRIILSQLVIYLAKAPKDNSSYIAIEKALQDAEQTMNLPVPLHLRNAPTKLMKELGYSKGYVYDHNVDKTDSKVGKDKISGQQCLPDELIGRDYFD